MESSTPLANAPAKQPHRRYTLYTALIAAGMMLAIYIMLGVWPFGDGSIVTGDLGGLYLNYFGHLRRFIFGEAGFAYGFDKGLGGSLLGLFAYYYASPLNLVYAAFPVRWFPVAASLVLFCKVVLACVFCRVYIGRKFPKLKWRSVPLALCYGFMAYTFAYAQNIMWHDVLVLLPLICLGIDRLIAGKGPGFYIAMLALAIFANFYIAFMACIFAVLYFFYTMLTRGEAEKALGWKKPLLGFGLGSLLGGGLCAALLVPALYNINQNKGGLLEYSFSFEPNFPLARLPERFVWGSFATSDMEGHLPFVYCGLLVLVLALSYFFSKAVPLKHKLLGGGMLLLFLLSFWVQGLDQIWHGLKAPIWFPARYAFIFCFFAVLLAAKALEVHAAGRMEVLLSGGVLFLVLLAMTAFPIAVSRSRILLSAAAVLGYAFLLLLAASATSLKRRRTIYGVIIAMAVVELSMNGFYITHGFENYTLTDHQQRADEAGGTIEAIQAFDDGDYRIAENHYHSLNDAMLYGYRGLSHFGSTQDGYAQSVLYNLGLRNYEGGGPYLSGGTAFADGVLGLKYLSAGGSWSVSGHWQRSELEAPWPVYQNPCAMPMLFSFDGAGLTDARSGEYEADPFAYQNDMFAELGGGEELFATAGDVLLEDATGATIALDGSLPPGARYILTARQSGTHYAWLESGTHLLATLIDGVETDTYFAPQNKGVIELGHLEAGQTVELAFSNAAPIEISAVRFVCMDDEALKRLVAAAYANAGSFAVEDGRVAGTVTAGGERPMLYTSIPWDEDWRAEVNGKPVALTRFMGGLIALELEPGENRVQLRYRPGGLAAGWVITGLSAAGCGVLVLLWLRKRKGRAVPAEADEMQRATQTEES